MADNSTITIQGIDDLNKKLKQLETDSPGFEKRLRATIRKAIGEVRSALSKNARSELQMKSDPRSAYKAVRNSVYKRIFGGQVNILQSRRAGARSAYEPPRKLQPGQRGGNRLPRSKRTEQLMGYEGKDRGFILRFLNLGTNNRTTHYGNRGSIAARNWFAGRSQQEMEKVAERIQEIVDKIIKDEFV